MSVKIMEHVWAHSQRKDGELLVMLALADFANHSGECWPALDVLAQKARLSRKQLCVVLNKLEAVGEILRTRSKGGWNRRTRYFINLRSENSHQTTVLKGNSYQTTVLFKDKNSPVEVTRTKPSRNRHKESIAKALHSFNSPTHKKRKLTPAASDLRVKPFLSWFAKEYETRFGSPYAVNWGKDAKRVKELPPAFDFPRLKELAARFFESDDAWVREHGGFTLGVFMSQLNKLASTANGNGHANPPEVKDLDNGWLEVDGRRMDRATYERRYGERRTKVH